MIKKTALIRKRKAYWIATVTIGIAVEYIVLWLATKTTAAAIAGAIMFALAWSMYGMASDG